MVEVTESDRIAAAAYMKLVGSKRWSQEGILSGGCDNTSIVQAFATHRKQAAKAERDRCIAAVIASNADLHRTGSAAYMVCLQALRALGKQHD